MNTRINLLHKEMHALCNRLLFLTARLNLCIENGNALLRILFAQRGSILVTLPTIQGVFYPSKISGVGTCFGLLVPILPGPNKQREAKPGLILS